MQFSIDNYLTLRKIQHLIHVKELLLYKKWDEYIPYFLDCKSDIYYLLEENDDGKKHSKKYYREWLLKIYRVKKYPPKWLQCCEWPMVDGKPLLFLYQTGFPNKHDFITYYFQKEDGTIAIVEQYD